MDDLKLAQLLEKACPRPAYLSSTNGGPALALALHCLMVDAGFVLVREDAEAGSSDPEARFMPQKDWNGMLLDQWVFTYTHPGKARKFTLHCSLQKVTKRMFIHSCEENNYANVQVLGLQLDNYVPHPAALRSNNWAAGATTPTATTQVTSQQQQGQLQQQQQPGQEAAGKESEGPRPVVHNAAKMAELLTQYVVQPLLQAAEDEQGPPPPPPLPQAAAGTAAAQRGSGGGGGAGWSSQAGSYLAVAATVALSVGVALVVLHRSSSGRQQAF